MFQVAISEAIAGRRHLDRARVEGGLRELVGPDLAITEAGLAARDHGLVVKSEDFPSPQDAEIARLRGEPIPEPVKADFPVQDGIDEVAWAVAVERAAEVHP